MSLEFESCIGVEPKLKWNSPAVLLKVATERRGINTGREYEAAIGVCNQAFPVNTRRVAVTSAASPDARISASSLDADYGVLMKV